MGATVEDVHHRHRQQVGVGPADVAVERQPGRLGRGLGDGERGAEDGVGAEVGLVGGAVELVHRLVDLALVVGTETLDGRADLLDHRVDGLLHTLAEVAVAAVTQLDGLELPRRRAARHGRAAERTVVEQHLDLDGGVAARVEDLAGADSFDGCHVCLPGPNGSDWWILTVALTLLVPYTGATAAQPVDTSASGQRTMAGMEPEPITRYAALFDSCHRAYDQSGVPFFGRDRPGSRGTARAASRREGARHRLGSRRRHLPARPTPSARPAGSTPSTSPPAWSGCSADDTARPRARSTSPRATPPTRGRPRRRTTSSPRRW